MVRPQSKADKAGGHNCHNNIGVTHETVARKDGNDHRDHADRRDKLDVYLGMAKDPEEMLPEHRATTRRWIEELGVELAIQF
jgi:hypothetical protein